MSISANLAPQHLLSMVTKSAYWWIFLVLQLRGSSGFVVLLTGGTIMRKMVLLAVCLPFAALADDKNKCLDSRDHHVAISGCSEIIRRDPKDAVAYYLRGNALAKNGDLGQAIADFSKAIALNPGFPPAYDSRAAAYVAKGDYTRAVADVTKAGEVAPKKGPKAANQTPATKEKAPAGFAQVKPPAGLVKKPPAAGTAAPAKETERQGYAASRGNPRIGSAAWWRARQSAGE